MDTNVAYHSNIKTKVISWRDISCEISYNFNTKREIWIYILILK